MSQTNGVSIKVEDVFEELRQENRRLLNELIFAEKCINLLEKLRTNLKSFNNNCKCDETIENKLNFNQLETKYKSIKRQFDGNYGLTLSATKIDNFYDSCPKKKIYVNSNIKLIPKSIWRKAERNKRLRIIEMQRKIIRQIDLKKSQNQSNNWKTIDRKNINDDNIGTDDNKPDSKVHQMVENSSKLLEPFDCMECELKFNNKKRLIDHTKTSHNELYDNRSGIWKCNQRECSFQSDRFRNLTLHKFHHLGKKPFLCDWPGCEAGFFRNTHLVIHRGSHEGIRKYKCEWPSCGQSFRSKCNLKYHYNSHTGEKPYKCEWPGCDSRFSTLSSKTRHKVVHSVITGYRCDWKDCGKSFKFKGSLNRHYILHENDKNCQKTIKCQSIGCEIRFVNKRQMTQHLKLSHN